MPLYLSSRCYLNKYTISSNRLDLTVPGRKKNEKVWGHTPIVLLEETRQMFNPEDNAEIDIFIKMKLYI